MLNRTISVALWTILLIGSVATSLFSATAFADDAELPALDEVSKFDIPTQSLGAALLEFSQQADVQIIMAAATARDLESSTVAGQQTNRDALEQLLDNGDLSYTEHSNRTIAIYQDKAGGDSDSKNSIPPAPVLIAQNVDQAKTSTGSSKQSDEEAEGPEVAMENIVVTGTNIRGIAPKSSPTLTITRGEILSSGVTTIPEFLRTLPQNFGGGSTETTATGLPNDDDADFNNTFGSGINLRGLGSGATLVLLNGQRIAPASVLGGFVDVSMIPVSAIERIEILTDGASSIYGGDAVAGVVNFVLRDDFEGAETSLRYGAVTEGDLKDVRIGQTFGTSWNSGRALLTYEYRKRDELNAEDRDLSLSTDQEFFLLPRQQRDSVVASLRQNIFRDGEFFADVTYSKRDSFSASATSRPTNSFSESETLTTSLGFSVPVVKGWMFDLATNYSENDSERARIRTDIDSLESIVAVNSELWSVGGTLSGELLELAGNSLGTAIGFDYREEDFTTQRADTGNIGRQAERNVTAVFGELYIPLLNEAQGIPGIQKLELNLSARYEDFSDFGSATSPKIGLLWSPAGGLNLRASYSESFSPPDLGRVGAIDGEIFIDRNVENGFFGQIMNVPVALDGQNVAFIQGTAANGLEPEESEAFTTGITYSKDWGNQSFDLDMNYFQIEYEGRLGTVPLGGVNFINAHNISFVNPGLFPEEAFIFDATAEQVQAIVNTVNQATPIFDLTGGGLENVTIVNMTLLNQNLAFTKVEGLDATVSYSHEIETGIISASLNASYLLGFERQLSDTSPVIDEVNTLFNPVDLKLRGSLSFVRDAFAASLFVNYTDGYMTSLLPDARPVDSYTTVDLSVRYDLGAGSQSRVLNGLELALSAQNVFDEDPPSVPIVATVQASYDSTNASPLGRFLAIELRKTW